MIVRWLWREFRAAGSTGGRAVARKSSARTGVAVVVPAPRHLDPE
jgi:hypothetical protein